MGKEQDLIQAAKSGNVAHIEKILGNKARKSGIQRYVRKPCRKYKSFSRFCDDVIRILAVSSAGLSTLIIKTSLETLLYIMQL